MGSALDEILNAFQDLMDAQAPNEDAPAEGSGNFRCEHCVSCHDCRFCTECENCRDCTYCYACEDCLSLTQCRQCDACETLTHSDLCAECNESSYLTLCLDCEGCVQCFGCVGLIGREFHILNEKVPRKEYFVRVKELRAELDQRARAGWRPPWCETADPEEGTDADQAIDAIDAWRGVDADEPPEARPADRADADHGAALADRDDNPQTPRPLLPEEFDGDAPPLLRASLPEDAMPIPDAPQWGNTSLVAEDAPLPEALGLSHDDLSWLDAPAAPPPRTTADPTTAPLASVIVGRPPAQAQTPPPAVPARASRWDPRASPEDEVKLEGPARFGAQDKPSLARGTRPTRRTAAVTTPPPPSLLRARRPTRD